MPTGENINHYGNSEEQNPWQKMASEILPFEEHDKTEETLDGNPEHIDIDSIDISTDEGKFEWLDGLVSNAMTKAQEDLDKATSLDDEEQITDATYRLHHARRQQRMLDNLFSNTSDGNVLGRLRENYGKFSQLSANLSNAASDQAKQIAAENHQAASDLLGIMESETVRRGLDPASEQPIKNEHEVERDLNQESKIIFQNLIESKALNPRDSYTSLSEFANLRSQVIGAEKPIHIFLLEKYWRDGQGRKLRIDPATGNPFTGNWSWQTRAFHTPDGTYLDFPARPASEGTKPLEQQTQQELGGYEAADAIIDFAYTCEHELQHDLQGQRLDKKEISYDALRIAKDHILINTLGHFTGDAEYFYMNAHDGLFVEADANAAADALFDELLPIDGLLANKIANPNDPSEFQYTMHSILQRRQSESAPIDKNFSLALSQNKIGMPEKTYQGTAEEIVSKYCDDIIKLYPDYLKLYPALSLEYNTDGTPRSREDIEADLKHLDQINTVKIGNQEIPAKKLKAYYNKILQDLH